MSLCAVLSGVRRILKISLFGRWKYSTMSSTTRAVTPPRISAIFLAVGVSLERNASKATRGRGGGDEGLDRWTTTRATLSFLLVTFPERFAIGRPPLRRW